MTQALVSVIVPSYNHPEFLERRMQSLLAQTYTKLEIIIIDDCSSLNNVEILKQFLSDSRVSLVVREDNGGVSAVNNQGIQLSSGQYVIFAQCDDACDLKMIEQLVASLDSHPSAAISFSRSLMVDESDRILGDDFFIRERAFRERCSTDTVIQGYEMTRFLLHSCVIPNMSSVMFRRACFDKVGLFSLEYKSCLDWDMFFRIARNYDFCYLSEPLNWFRQHPSTIRSKTNNRAAYEEFFRVLLPEISKNQFNTIECILFRFHVMYLWSVSLINPRFIGLTDFLFHFKQVWCLDPLSLFLLPFALLKRLFEMPVKLYKWRQRNPQTEI
jgi:glycosyltransferase involved in cell wall biosynthesis